MRDLVSAVRLREGQTPTEDLLLKTYNTAMSTAAAEVINRWKSGYPPPLPDGRLEVAKATSEGVVVGFNVYLVWGEIQSLGGKMREEPV